MPPEGPVRRRSVRGERAPRLRARAARVLSWCRVALRRAADVFPWTPLGLLVLGCAAFALVHFGIRRLDLILLVVGAVLLAVGALASVLVIVTSIVLWAIRRRLPTADPLSLECGAASRTGFSMQSLWYVPMVSVSWSWMDPGAVVSIVKTRGRMQEVVTPRRRGYTERIVRRVEVRDAFGFVKIAFRVHQERVVRIFPSSGALRHVDLLRSVATGDDVAHPAGRAAGDRVDLRRYAPGDPMRLILWKVYARTRQTVVRTPERALSPARQTCAYVVGSVDDEAAAGAARAALESGALGADWVLGADGAPGVASTDGQALDLLARSGAALPAQHGAGFERFLEHHGGLARAVAFVPPTPGPWLGRVLGTTKARLGSRLAGIEFIVCTDGVDRSPRRGILARFAFRSGGASRGAVVPNAADVGEVMRALGGLGARVVLVDRKAGRVYAEGSRRLLDAA